MHGDSGRDPRIGSGFRALLYECIIHRPNPALAVEGARHLPVGAAVHTNYYNFENVGVDFAKNAAAAVATSAVCSAAMFHVRT